MKMKTLAAVAVATALLCAGQIASAKDKLDSIIESGKLRCAVVLDFPPMGSRDASNNPIGFHRPDNHRVSGMQICYD